MKNGKMVKLGVVALSGTIGMFDEASVLAVGDDIIVADIMGSGRIRQRQVLRNTRPEDVNFDAEVVFVSRRVRRELHRLFDNEEVERGNAPHFTKWTDHYVSAPGGFKPIVRKGEILVADYNMSGTHYFRLSEEDRAWLVYRDGIKI